MTALRNRIIATFRARNGRYGDSGSRELVLLHVRGPRSGTRRVYPLWARRSADGWTVAAPEIGSPETRGWFADIAVHPDAELEVAGVTGIETVAVSARLAPTPPGQKPGAVLFSPSSTSPRSRSTRTTCSSTRRS